MTAIFYPDRTARSPRGHFLLEARSPDNLAHAGGDGRGKDGWGHQNNFLYRLLHRDHPTDGREPLATDTIVWERRQPASEESPHELIVADDGWCVIRTHGHRPEVVLVAPDGEMRLRVRVVGGYVEEDPKLAREQTVEAARNPAAERVPTAWWAARHMSMGTAGNFWAENSWPYFCEAGGSVYFVWRAYWGDRLVVDLERGMLVGAADRSAELNATFDAAERRSVATMLDEMAANAPVAKAHVLTGGAREQGDRSQWPLRYFEPTRLIAAFHLAGVHGLREHAATLGDWEAVDVPGSWTSSVALAERWDTESQALRPVIVRSLRTLGVQPAGHPPVNFRRGWDKDVERLPLADRPADLRERLARVSPRARAVEVLAAVGAPDHVRKYAKDPQSFPAKWVEEWEYDILVEGEWRTTRLTWEQVKYGRAAKLASVGERASYSLMSDRRTVEQLRW